MINRMNTTNNMLDEVVDLATRKQAEKKDA